MAEHQLYLPYATRSWAFLEAISLSLPRGVVLHLGTRAEVLGLLAVEARAAARDAV